MSKIIIYCLILGAAIQSFARIGSTGNIDLPIEVTSLAERSVIYTLNPYQRWLDGSEAQADAILRQEVSEEIQQDLKRKCRAHNPMLVPAEANQTDFIAQISANVHCYTRSFGSRLISEQRAPIRVCTTTYRDFCI